MGNPCRLGGVTAVDAVLDATMVTLRAIGADFEANFVADLKKDAGCPSLRGDDSQYSVRKGGLFDMADAYAAGLAARSANSGRNWVATDEELSLGKHLLVSGDQEVVNGLADIHRFRPEFAAGAVLPALVSVGYELPHVSSGARDAMAGRSSGLRMYPVIIDALFDVTAKRIGKVLSKAVELYPDVDHRALWIGPEPVGDDGYRLRLRLVFFVPEADRWAADWVNAPPLGVYPTRAYPMGYCVQPDGVWRPAKLVCSAATGLAAALVVPFDDLVGMDFAKDGQLQSVKLADLDLRCGVLADVDCAYERPGWSDMAEPEVGRLFGTTGRAMKYALAKVEADDPRGVLQAPPIMEVLRLQRPVVLSAARVPVGGPPRVWAPQHRRVLQKRRARRARLGGK